MLTKSDKGSYKIPSLQNEIKCDEFDEEVDDDDEKCSLMNKYFCLCLN